ncbi:hypothetical protein NU195Hw_g1944t1 [Hortaea werneckii]
MPKVLQSGDDLAESHIDPNVLKLPSSEARSTDMNNPGLPSDNSAPSTITVQEPASSHRSDTKINHHASIGTTIQSLKRYAPNRSKGYRRDEKETGLFQM